MVSEPGYEYAFQISGWGWVNLLTAIVVAIVAVALFMNAPWARAAATVVNLLGHRGLLPLDAFLSHRLNGVDSP